MKRNFQILFILLFVLTGIISPVRGKNKTGDCNIRFCTYNIRGDLPNDGINSRKFRKDSLCKIINNHDFDIVCMQEVLANQAGRYRASHRLCLCRNQRTVQPYILQGRTL
ncbi:hypothetical protein NXV73_09510 [Bacteroides salyersiae]|nr:hypothetical protein [Bacteroides salyersiae]